MYGKVSMPSPRGIGMISDCRKTSAEARFECSMDDRCLHMMPYVPTGHLVTGDIIAPQTLLLNYCLDLHFGRVAGTGSAQSIDLQTVDHWAEILGINVRQRHLVQPPNYEWITASSCKRLSCDASR
jgi:hypothetical protein